MQASSTATPSPVSNRVRMPGRVSWSPHADARLVKMHLDGLSLRAIALAFRLSRSTIACHARQIGLTVPTRPPLKRPLQPAESEQRDDCNREPLPAGHPISWNLITAGTCMEGEAYEYPWRDHFRTHEQHRKSSEAHRPAASQPVA